MTAQSWHSIASGKPYPVTGLTSGEVTSLDQFLGDAEFTIDGEGGPVVVCGHGVPLEDKIRFHEKDTVGGKDVRVWHVSSGGSGFVAESIAAF
ncbi:hypothetical protein GCU67_02125 [Modestobacter muralis]|uniref:Uncharacterized protein n=1 Tax=Modestobacter muralis TaxID=1608614 RepID=A0A6P0H200_9ACTN|nr:hypothetical protein [Modestobacter muralis]NEK92973.1 hypothetical protein [Modestobacter muralis]NEN49740.1 hypothetical protein [Modestobacter muralis]